MFDEPLADLDEEY